MTETDMLIRIMDVLDNKELHDSMNNVVAELSENIGLHKVSVFETDYKQYICSNYYEWEYGRSIESKASLSQSFKVSSRRQVLISRREAKALRDVLSTDSCIVLDDFVDERIATLFSKVTGSYVEGSIIVPLIASGEQVGFILYDMKDHSKFSNHDFFLLVTRVVGSYFRSKKSDAESQMKSEFLSRMSHEIRTPMNAIIGMTGIAEKSLDDIDRVKDCLTKIDSSTKYLLSLINDILDMSKIESGKMEVGYESFSISSVLDGIEALLTPQADSKGIALKTIREYSDTNVLGDELKVNQVLINLVGNALKFTPEGGKIIVRVEEILSEDDYVVLRFLVKDSGIGIEAKDIDRIFKAFEQAGNNSSSLRGGTGLGLSISYNLVKLMGGELQVSSTVGKGSDFYFTLSFKRADGAKEPEEETSQVVVDEEDYDFTGRRVLVVEDNELNAEIAQTILEMVGFETDLAENGKIAVDKFNDNDEHYYDAILMDIRMPVMDGLEATRLIRSSKKRYSKQVPIIAMTANAFDEDMKKSIKSGMDGHLSKPVDTKKLYSELKRVISYNG